MALIITVILIAVVTFMAITFLAVSRRERNAVTTTTDTTTAQLAADDALAAAEAQIIANTLATTNPYNFGLLVSTNYINRFGFVAGVASPTNVNYYYPNGNPVTPANINDFLQLLANLQYLPRAPVFAQTNANPNAPLDFRFYLDLNRNGVDDTNGLVPEIAADDQYIRQDGTVGSDNGNVLTNFHVGDPEWIGVLQHPNQPYGPNNPFVARYAFVAVPIGNALDLNAIYNEAVTKTVRTNSADTATLDGFLRNQGIGSWEINLAAFLTDLNTNQWDPPTIENAANNPYNYLEPNFVNKGVGFEDALSLLSYRYNFNYHNLLPVGGPNGIFTTAPLIFLPFQNNIDYYGDGPLMTTPAGINEAFPPQKVTLPWSGADNTNHFFDLQELFNPGEASVAVTNHLGRAGNGVSTYDRYTYYRLLSQMGVESAPVQNQINLNYSNAQAVFYPDGALSNITYYPQGQTNFVQWQPLQFFAIAADRMLRAYSQEWLAENPSNYVATYGSFTNISTDPVNFPTNVPTPFGISDIPVLVSNQFVYTPAVQRVLQLAANIYDATTNNLGAGFNTHDYPSVFRPTFFVVRDPASGYTNVYINGYEQVVSVIGTNDFQLDAPSNVTDLLTPPFGSGTTGITYTNVNVYGVPWVIGAKKGFPNFNEFSMLTLVGVTRKLEVTRPSLDADLSQYETNQMYILSISNSLGVECWNSYASNYFPSPGVYPNGLTIVARDIFSMGLSNANTVNFPKFIGYLSPTNNPSTYPFANTVSINSGTTPNYWPGTKPLSATGSWPYSGSFDIPLLANVAVLTNAIYSYPGNNPNPAYTWTRYPDAFIPAAQDINPNYDYPDLGTPPLPQFYLLITNRLQVFMLDGNHVIDYAQFAGPDTVTNLNMILADASVTNLDRGLWNTNSITGLTNGTPYGVLNQILYSKDPNYYGPNGQDPRVLNSDNGTWRDTVGGANVSQAVVSFQAFFSPNHIASSYTYHGISSGATTNLAPTAQVPFTPTRYVYGYTSWQANDPLVHYLASDLNYSGSTAGGHLKTGWHQNDNSWGSNAPPTNLRRVNDRYQPWGWPWPIPTPFGVDGNPLNLAYKDPLVRSSDNWDFPTYKMPTIGWLGRVHRGTPWQTVYLKATNILQEIQPPGSTPIYVGTNTWAVWTGDMHWVGNTNFFDAANMAPAQDRLLFDLFTTAPNDNATRGLLSVNVGASDPNNPQAGLAAWSALFSGVLALSNNLPNSVAGSFYTVLYQNPLPGELAPSFTNLVINPAGPVNLLNPPPLWQIVTNINGTRANYVNADGLKGTFEHAGDILATPQLSQQSPFLNWNNAAQQTNGISDEMYEWLPQQVMSLLRVSGTPQSPMRYVIYSYGQALKPAPNGIYTGSQTISGSESAFGMVTNYQVVAESAARVVVNFGSVETNLVTTNALNNWISVPAVTNNNAQIKQYNALPPY